MEIKEYTGAVEVSQGIVGAGYPPGVGGYMLILNPTPEVIELLKAMRQFKYYEDEFEFKMIAKPPQVSEFDPNATYASIGWKIFRKKKELPIFIKDEVEQAYDLEERVEGIQ